MSQIYDRACDVLRSFYDARIHTPPVLPIERYFPEHTVFAENWEKIRAECLELMADIGSIPQIHELMGEQASLATHGDRFWRLLVLRAYGVDHRANQAMCPFITSLFQGRSSIKSVTLSLLDAKKHIPSHRGPLRGVLRYHLGLVIPLNPDGTPSNRLRIDGTLHRLGEGSELLWDDTYAHEVWNDSESVRAALVMDVIRPQMPLMLRLVTRFVLLVVGISIRVRGLTDGQRQARPPRDRQRRPELPDSAPTPNAK